VSFELQVTRDVVIIKVALLECSKLAVENGAFVIQYIFLLLAQVRDLVAVKLVCAAKRLSARLDVAGESAVFSRHILKFDDHISMASKPPLYQRGAATSVHSRIASLQRDKGRHGA